MATWTLVPCLVTLRAEFNALAPDRDKASDGSVGDTSHAAKPSDHNPDETGNTPNEDSDRVNEVHAIDVDANLRKAGWEMVDCVGIIIRRHREGLDDRLQNVIYNRRIWSRSWDWTARPYTGANAHTEHAHFSARYTSAQEADTSPWGLLEEDDDMTQDQLLDALESPRGQAALAKAAGNGVSDKQLGRSDTTIGMVLQREPARFDAVDTQLATVLERLPEAPPA